MGGEDRTLGNLRGINTTLEKPIKGRLPILSAFFCGKDGDSIPLLLTPFAHETSVRARL
jgi:hypothetical protein